MRVPNEDGCIIQSLGIVYSDNTSVESDDITNNEFALFPNPAEDRVFIRLTDESAQI